MDKKKMNKEELQSRREFFKKAAKGTLPMIAAIALASAPTLVKAAEDSPMGCLYGCNIGCAGSCASGCTGDCYRSCTGGCDSSCRGTCAGNCAGRCTGSCTGSCAGGSTARVW